MINTTMKTFKEYLAETKKVYSFKIKVAGDLPEKFQENLKRVLDQYKIITLEKLTTPIQESPMDFPELSNKEVHIFDLILEYPMTAPEIITYVKQLGIMEECLRVRGSGEPSEADQLMNQEPSGEAFLNDPYYTKESKTDVKHKDYFGNDFNKNFLKELASEAKKRNKEEGKGEYNIPSVKKDKMGLKSPIGS